MSDLNPLAPGEAVDMFLDQRQEELSKESWRKNQTRLQSFVEFCRENDIENLNRLTGRDLHDYRKWRKEGRGEGRSEVKNVTVRSNLRTLQVFLEYCANIDAVERGLRERVMLPEVEKESRSEKLEEDRAREILDYLEEMEFASRRHVIVSLMWHTAARLGALRALDVGDFDSEDLVLEVRHRPDTGTPLKNGVGGERDINIGELYGRMLEKYIEYNRHDVTDDYGREPLITSEHGRLTDVPYRSTAYRATQPCLIGDCPHDKDPKTCEWTEYDYMSKCPSSQSPHNIRRGSITKHRKDGVPAEIVSDRVDASIEVIDKHYDKRTKREKANVREEFLKNV